MKFVYVTLLVAVLVAVSVNAKKEGCEENCDLIYDPVCGFNGSCYRNYGNECVLKAKQCTENKDLKMVNMALCEEARAKTNPEVKSCSQ